MALFNCPECGHTVSDKADACPSCGYVIKPKTTPNNNNRNNIIIFLALGALIAAIALVGVLLYNANNADNSETSVSTEATISSETTSEQQDSAVVDDSAAGLESHQGQSDEPAKDDKISMKDRDVFTLVYTTSDDGFLNIRSKPSMDGAILGEINDIMHGLGDGILIKKGPKWSKVRKGRVEGWVSNKFLGRQTWYSGSGRPVIVANQPKTTIYIENYGDGSSYSPFEKVPKGTIIADEYNENGGYYVLESAHDYLYVKKSDVVVMNQ